MASMLRQMFVATLVCECLLLGTQSSQAQSASVSVATTVSLEKSSVTQHEPVLLELTFENPSEQEVVISLGDDDEKIELKVTDPEGRVFRRPRPVVRQGFGPSDAFYVAAGKSSVGYVALTEWFDFGELGIYQIEANLSSSPSSKEGFSYSIQGNYGTLRLRVLPRDETSLEAACADLLNRTQDLHSSSGALTAAKGLSRVNDPIAVPFLVAAMKATEFKGLMIDALARLKTRGAVDALLVASRSGDAETRDLARSALVRIGVAPGGADEGAGPPLH
jgi:hypothetical protein